MSHEATVAALEAAVAAESGPPAPAQQAPAPVETPVAPEGSEVPPPAPAAPPAVEPEVTEAEPFFNPDTLDPELLPGWKQLQAAFTEKTQAIAEQRRAIEAYGDPDDLGAAVELYQRISDPQNWPQLATELSEAMQEAGLSAPEANALAAETLASQPMADPLAGLDLDDPELAPLVSAVQAQAARQAQLEQQLQAFQTDQQLQAEYAEQEREQQARSDGYAQQLRAIAQANPTYDQEDLNDIVRLAPFYNDDFAQAQAQYENIVARRLSRYYEGKQASLTPSVQPMPGSGASSAPVAEEKTLAEIGDEMVEYMRGLQASGELDI